jgi:hypothetical protein
VEAVWKIRHRRRNPRARKAQLCLALGEVVIASQLEILSADELSEYLRIVASLIKETDLHNARFHLVDLECRAILDGVRNEDELVKAITPKLAVH